MNQLLRPDEFKMFSWITMKIDSQNPACPHLCLVRTHNFCFPLLAELRLVLIQDTPVHSSAAAPMPIQSSQSPSQHCSIGFPN